MRAQSSPSERISMSLSSLVGQIRCATNEQQPRQRNDNDNGLTTGQGLGGTHVGRRAGRCAAGHFDSSLSSESDYDSDWDNMAQMWQIWAWSVQVTSLTYLQIFMWRPRTPHYHPLSGGKGRGDEAWPGQGLWKHALESLLHRNLRFQMYVNDAAASPGFTMVDDDFQFSDVCFPHFFTLFLPLIPALYS